MMNVKTVLRGFVRVYVCMYVCMYVRMYVCMYGWIYALQIHWPCSDNLRQPNIPWFHVSSDSDVTISISGHIFNFLFVCVCVCLCVCVCVMCVSLRVRVRECRISPISSSWFCCICILHDAVYSDFLQTIRNENIRTYEQVASRLQWIRVRVRVYVTACMCGCMCVCVCYCVCMLCVCARGVQERIKQKQQQGRLMEVIACVWRLSIVQKEHCLLYWLNVEREWGVIAMQWIIVCNKRTHTGIPHT